MQLPPTATPLPTASPTPGGETPAPSGAATPTSASSPAATPTGGAPLGSALPSWVLPVLLVVLAIALIEFFALVSRPKGRRAKRRR